MSGLTAKQERFVAAYIANPNATQAAITAGYSERTAMSIGHENLSKPKIHEAISAGQVAVIEKVAGSAEWIVEQAVEVVRRALKSEKRLGVANPALALLAKRHPEFASHTEVTGRDGAPIQVALLAAVGKLTDEQLEQLVMRTAEGEE